MDLEEFEACIARLGGIRPAARHLGIAAETLRDYRRGTRPVSLAVAEALRSLGGG
jgi:hypothetical protein